MKEQFHILKQAEDEINDYGIFLVYQMLFEAGKMLQDFLSVKPPKGFIFFLNGAAEAGKAFVYNAIIATLRKKENIAIMVASSGIVSLLLDGGRTAHSTFRISINVVGNSKCGFTKQSIHPYLFRTAKLIIWDEVPMQYKYCVDTVERALRDVCNNSRPFGGITVVLGGNFHQILPVVSKGGREQIVSTSLRRSLLWQHVQVQRLVDNMRLDYAALKNKLFVEFLMKAGSNPEHIVQLPLAIQNLETVQDLILSIYPCLNESIKRQDGFLAE
ncbi:hypothetical protein GIB67_040336 [Kingdonia uniflora]|uniref:ATP-dependent DNA helicase n=1 Tax=Kingdonia uniflora TaxID=39325 RepID=A0A7J7L9F3_9MAGN|nr:hypothetical protein GIB67_040336 [Kingdonia uniflora]